jgi:UDP-N-acetylmuramoyl-tripeptide--D-alanyl-D-alanine ligase
MAEPLWTSDAMLAATGGRLEGGAFACTGVSIDSRSLLLGDLFVALAAERDGHEFVDAALERGAAAALVSQPGPGRRLIVGDTLKALETLGAAARDRAPKARRGAVTGSVGKTSLTQMIRAGLERAGPAHGSVKSFNNHIGVPLTLARMPRSTERAIFEIGMNHAGEITPLVRLVRPHAVAITNVGPVHTENFPDGETGVAHAKAEIFEGLDPGGVAVLNADNAWFDRLAAAARNRGAEVAAFGSAPACAAQLTGFRLQGAGAWVSAVFRGRPIDIELRQIGAHWGLMSLAALLMLEALDVRLDDGLAALAAFEPLEGRGAERSVSLAGGAFTLIDESYNANPVSVAAALRTLSLRQAAGRRIVVLTDMLELGPQAAAHHAALAGEIEAAGIDLVFCAGPLMEALWRALPAARRGAHAPIAAELVPELTGAVAPGDLVMVKGSKASNAGSLAAALAKLDQSSGEAA